MIFEIFRDDLDTFFIKERESKAVAKPYDTVLMFKVLILQSLYNLSDNALEFQILDRC
jgi:IS5 family transposase